MTLQASSKKLWGTEKDREKHSEETKQSLEADKTQMSKTINLPQLTFIEHSNLQK